MHLELVIVDGPQPGRRISLGRNPVTFGRSVGATIPFQQDNFMSGMHLSVQYALSCVIVLDLRSSNGTFLNGQRITQAMAVPGDVIKIGTLTMQVVIGKAPAPPAEPVEPVAPPEIASVAPTLEMPAVTEPEIEPVADLAVTMIAVPGAEMVEKVHQSVLNRLLETDLPLFCLLDPGAHNAIPALLNQAPEPKESLYEGAAGNMLSKVAPYVVQLGPDSSLLHELVKNGWGQGWACFFTSEAPLEELGRHFRKFFMVQLEGGKEVYFRFYDPAVLRGFLSAGSEEELTVFFGPVVQWMIEAKNSAMMLKLRNDGTGLHTMTIPLAVTASRFRKQPAS